MSNRQATSSFSVDRVVSMLLIGMLARKWWPVLVCHFPIEAQLAIGKHLAGGKGVARCSSRYSWIPITLRMASCASRARWTVIFRNHRASSGACVANFCVAFSLACRLLASSLTNGSSVVGCRRRRYAGWWLSRMESVVPWMFMSWIIRFRADSIV